MSTELAFEVDWKALARGTPEERSAFSAFGIRHHNFWLTEAEDSFARSLTQTVHVSVYPLAEWLAWNWWRLRWEPRTPARDWHEAHGLASVGRGTVWPDITIFSDGERVALIAKPTRGRPEEPLRYIADHAAVVSAQAFETVIDDFMALVGARLDTQGIADSNFQTLWRDVIEERRDSALALRRKFEALLGLDPDQGDPEMIEQLVTDAGSLGVDAMAEIAADRPYDQDVLTAARLRDIADREGTPGSLEDSVRLGPGIKLSGEADVPAWRRGADLARLLRHQEHLGDGSIPDARLAQLAGVGTSILDLWSPTSTMSFIYQSDNQSSRTVLRSKWREGKRFELARLIADRVTNTGTCLFPATRSTTYRQKFQRSFAAEFLAPFNAVEDHLSGDYSQDAQIGAAREFQVSEMTIRTLLVNHGRLERDDLEEDFGAAA